MRPTLLAAVALLWASLALGAQPGATGAARWRDGAVDVGTVNAGDSGASTTRAANTNILQQRRADDCTAQTDGAPGETCFDDLGGAWRCEPTSGACDTPAEWSTRTRFLDFGVQAVTVNDTGNSSAATFNLDPSASYVEVACNDTNGGCDGTMQETSAREGRLVTIMHTGSGQRIRFTDVANVLTLLGSPTYLTANQPALVLLYDGGQWRQQVVPLRIEENNLLVGMGVVLNFDPAFDVSVDSTDLTQINIAPGSQITQVGSIDKADLPSTVVHTDQANTYTTGTQSFASVTTTLGTVNGTVNLGGATALAVPNSTSAGSATVGRIHLDTNGTTAAMPQVTVGDGTNALPLRTCWVERIASANATGSTGYSAGDNINTGFTNLQRSTYPVAVTLTALRCSMDRDQTNATTNTFTIQTSSGCTASSDGNTCAAITWNDSALSVSITGTTSQTENLTSIDSDVVSLSAGTYWVMKQVNNNGATINYNCTWIVCATAVW